MALAAAGGGLLPGNLILHASSAGFGMKDFTWYQYFFTECRAMFVYLGVFVLPVQLNADWDFPISRTILDHGAIFGLAVLLALVAAAWRYRRRFPLATYGFFVYLVLMAPTSSILPIQDPVAERRLYFSMLGLLLIVVDVLARVECPAPHAGVDVRGGGAGGRRRHARPRRGVGGSGGPLGGCGAQIAGQAAPAFPACLRVLRRAALRRGHAEFEKTAQLEKPGYDLLVDWGLAYDAMNRPTRRWRNCSRPRRCSPRPTCIRRSAWCMPSSGAGRKRWRLWPPRKRSTRSWLRPIRLPRQDLFPAEPTGRGGGRITGARWRSIPRMRGCAR